MSNPDKHVPPKRDPDARFGTRAVHAGWEPDDRTGAIMPPVYLTSTFVQDGPGQPRGGYEYTRTQNPTRFALQDALADVEAGLLPLRSLQGWPLFTPCCSHSSKVI